MNFRSLGFATGFTLLIWVSNVCASLVLFEDRSSFSAQGTVLENYGFEDVANYGTYVFPGDPWQTHGITYTSGENTVFGSNSYFQNPSAVLVYSQWSPMSGAIETSQVHYNLFGFDLGMLSSNPYFSSERHIIATITTNWNSYEFDLLAPTLFWGTKFYGFRTENNEYLTGFTLASADHQILDGPALDNVTLGVATVPLPANIGFMLAGLALLGVKARRKKYLRLR